jgi:glycosyltransferase involved in cell wall biosynthesis
MRLAIVYTTTQSFWTSCNSISDNLLACYQSISDDIEIFYYKELSDELEIYEQAKKIINFRPDKVVFIKNDNFFFNIMRVFSILSPEKKTFPDIIVHIYGDFTLEFEQWSLVEPLISGRNIKFFVACNSQLKLLKNFINDMSCCEVIPFPVDNTKFFPKEIKKIEGIDTHGFKKIFLYAGRLSYLKNIDKLIEVFAHEKLKDSLLLLIGAYDDVGFTFNHEAQVHGFQYANLNNLLAKQKNVLHIDHLDSKELIAYYNLADYFISLSTYHDEDFGMSCVEAAFCNTPLITTAWGGYNDFSDLCIGEQITVELTKDGPKLKNNFVHTVISNIDKSSNKVFNVEQTARKIFSIESVSSRLKNSIQTEFSCFTEFNSIFKKLAYNDSIGSTAFVKHNTGQLVSEYKEIYKSYVK